MASGHVFQESSDSDDEPNDRDLLYNYRENLASRTSTSCANATRKITVSGNGIQNEDSQNSERKAWYESLILTYYVFSKKLQDSVPSSHTNLKGLCKICKKKVSGRANSTSNWKRHLRVKSYLHNLNIYTLTFYLIIFRAFIVKPLLIMKRKKYLLDKTVQGIHHPQETQWLL